MRKQKTINKPDFNEIGKKALAIQAKSLSSLAKKIPPDFSNAIQILLNCDGKIIVSGLGKSGHIGNKFAATLASTGSPAQFVHITEASHGDLGMIKPGDVIIILSNSGETPGINELINYSQRLSIPTIAITAGLKSSLATKADIILGFEQFKEACPIGLAPTTSTTLAMALGDAIAVTLMQLKGFTTSDFKNVHPGGKIGLKLLTVQELMHTGDSMPLINKKTAMTEAIVTITKKGFGAAGIIDNNSKIIGIITDGDLRRNLQGLLGYNVTKVMSKKPHTIKPKVLASEALNIMSKLKITSLFVCSESNKPIGIIHLHDCLRAGVSE